MKKYILSFIKWFACKIETSFSLIKTFWNKQMRIYLNHKL